MKRNLEEWLAHAERGHSKTMDLGLERIGKVARQMGLLPFSIPTAIVAGTNGKGSTVAAIEAILLHHGYHTGATMSPHLRHFSERVRLDGDAADEAALCEAFEAVEEARLDVGLTYFEYNTLIALWLFRERRVDFAILEVGLGGRLDAFNVVDADVAVITSIGLDHQDLLGDDRESIGFEKAGVFRPGQQVVLGAEMPKSVTDRAATLGCVVAAWQQHFELEDDGTLRNLGVPWKLPLAARICGRLPAHNLAVATVAAAALAPIDAAATARAVSKVTLPGRLEVFEAGRRTVVLDVAHNEDGARFLAEELQTQRLTPRVVIYGALQDKPASKVVAALGLTEAAWCGVPTTGWRAQSVEDLVEKVPTLQPFEDFAAAMSWAYSASAPGDVILVFGSFSVVEAAHRWMS